MIIVCLLITAVILVPMVASFIPGLWLWRTHYK
jgi:hypothetical protein